MSHARKLMYEALRILGHQEWIRYGIRDRILRTFCNPTTIDSQEFEIDFFGFRYKGNVNCYIDWVVYFYGAYEKQELHILKDLIKEKHDPIFIDVGANIGQHSLFMAQYCNEIHSFEPYSAVRDKLQEKIDLNSISSITVHPVGLGDENKDLEFYGPAGANTGTGSFVKEHDPENNQLIDKLKVVEGDSYFNLAGIKIVSLIKIDVEGFEKSVLAGLKKILTEHRPVIFMEFSEATKASFSEQDE
jgi:FkbM family methyltransferase